MKEYHANIEGIRKKKRAILGKWRTSFYPFSSELPVIQGSIGSDSQRLSQRRRVNIAGVATGGASIFSVAKSGRPPVLAGHSTLTMFS